VPRLRYRIGLPRPGKWREVLNSDAAVYGGSNMGNSGGVAAANKPWQGQPCSAEFILPPLGILVFRPERAADEVVVGAEAPACYRLTRSEWSKPATCRRSGLLATLRP
jgi:1,4-alpha-glucan branching enzyme